MTSIKSWSLVASLLVVVGCDNRPQPQSDGPDGIADVSGEVGHGGDGGEAEGSGATGEGDTASADPSAESNQNDGADPEDADASSESSGSSAEVSSGDAAGEESSSSGGSGDDEQGSSSSSSDAGSGDDSGAVTSETEDACPEHDITFEAETPTVHLLIDQSGSMAYDLGMSGTTRWEVIQDVLVGSEESIIPALQDKIRFGISLYTGNTQECPLTQDISPLINNYTSIRSLLNSSRPLDGTPTAESIEVARQHLLAVTEPGPKILVLATDGDPYPCRNLANGDGRPATLNAVVENYNLGISTYVVSVGDDASTEHLADLAHAGAGGDPNAVPFYAVDRDGMLDAFDEIINGIRSCVLSLDESILPGSEDRGELTINGLLKTYGDPDGWRVNNPNEIELLGESCEIIKRGDVEIKVKFECDAIDPQ